jgi:hypothetical protein
MAADKLGRYLTSPLFLARANAAVKKAVEELEAKGIEPAYITRPAFDDVSSRLHVVKTTRRHIKAK